ncbi:procathepsin L-like isoform X1 [Hermetia illucens]|uniref:procathepsin L-like isoform X1 n=1 Tax=Hermetia illucens TaxID=343691 RepID=UPI0018CC1BED|nr:procathepsin L-like isoform X1 [Hermetia illucens]
MLAQISGAMKILIILSFAFATAASQGFFGGREGLTDDVVGRVAGRFSQSLDRLPVSGRLPNFANLPHPGRFSNFFDFLTKTGKRYVSYAEFKLRESIFNARQALADKHNELFMSGISAYEMGLNFFSDLKTEEFLAGLTGRRKNAYRDYNRLRIDYRKPEACQKVAIPDSFDWREQGGVTPVKFQGLECGACWAFAVTGSIEGHVFRKTGQLINLSEQNLIDCSTNYGNTGCDGGYHDYGYEYIIDNHGISKAEPYPYIEKQEQCHYRPAQRATTIKGYVTIPPGNETLIKEVVATLGPVAASVNAGPDSFQLYKGGIYDDEECNKDEVNHEILIVGYGSEKGKDYWIIKNSWTDKWGEKGYMRLPRNANSFCGIASEASYPIV